MPLAMGIVERTVTRQSGPGWKLEAGSWMLEAGSWMLDAGSWKLDKGKGAS
jgi:hypothetical protein